jgi:hypothetical protein
MTKEEETQIARFVVQATVNAQKAVEDALQNAFKELVSEDVLNEAWEEHFRTRG